MQLVRVNIQDPQNVLDTYGALAKYRIERDTTSAMTSASEVTTGTVVAGTTEYEYADATGVAGTHWYRVRYSTASPTLSTHYSGYGAVFQAGDAGGQVITLETFKTWASIGDTVDDPWLPIAVGSCNGAIFRGIGVDLGPSPDTVRTYDACDAVQNGRRLWIPGGIRTFTTVEVSTDGSTWTDVTSDVRIGPAVHSRRPGEPGAFVEFKPYTSSYSSFAGYAYVRITGPAFATFGWDAYPMDLVQAAVAAMQRAITDRDGRGSFPTETDMARYLNPATIAYYRNMYFPLGGR
jgi:hypothetical protein